MRDSPFIAPLLAVALLLTMWLASLHLYDVKKSEDALRWLQAERTDQSPFVWTFDAESDLSYGHGLKDFTMSDGVLSGDTDDPYFYLNLRGRYIDARRFDRLHLRIFSDEGGQLRLFHLEGDRGVIHASKRISLKAGWQELDLDLPALDWKAKDLASPDTPDQPSGWGNANGLVTALRVDPVVSGKFALDGMSLESSGARWPVSDTVETFKDLDSPLFDRMREDTRRVWVIAQDRWLRTPESAWRTREQIAREFPAAILFPTPPGDKAFAADAPKSPSAPRRLPAAFYLLGVGLLLGNRRPSGDTARPPVMEVTGFLVVFQAWLFLAPGVTGPQAAMLAAPLFVAAWFLQPRPIRPALIGDSRAWLWVAPLLLLGLLAILALPQPPSPEGPASISIPQELGESFLWALLQQYIVAVLFMGRLQPLLGRAGLVLSAGLFGWFHFPNFAMMVVTFLLGLILLSIYRRHPNLLAIAAAQAVLSLGLNGLDSQYLWLSREIGPTFLSAL